ncbi:SusC/RagA family TonB-linked outer membrane protein [Fulvivirgaceae bacterium BMA10]|uniref:SusC/RagA family TonB-linked outer membrane protein n=1 Tax=Splendidivirga corallicola TaxID=3051826 RepID=A0ABT8KN17_9BACT|nr:SusC/RagA family TonB-linked outer membrane protein [Fulvivirgaceae bacterium BMA10]
MKFKLLRILFMLSKYTFIGLLLQCVALNFLFATSGNAQKVRSVKEVFITEEFKNTTLEEAFRRIEAKTNFVFAVDESILKDKVKLNGSFETTSIADLLLEISKEAKVKFKQVNNNISVTKIKGAIQKQVKKELIEVLITVKGRVIDEDGAGIPGVNVLVKGTSNGTITDVEGMYSIEVPEDATLVFSSIGYVSEEIAVDNRTTINVSLFSSIEKLSEVVVVGYGTQKKANVTGAIVDIDDKELNQSPVANLSNALVGRLPGLVATQRGGIPGGDGSNLLVRGISTTGNSSPLVIVDGVQRGFTNLDPNEIESITILKDASAAAVYGVRGANGVILITTKRGEKGKPTISYSAEFSSQQPTRLPEFLDSYNYALLLNEAKRNEGRPEQFTDDDLAKFRDGSSPNTHPNTDWFEEALKSSAPQHQHNLSISGGGDKVSYFASIGYLNQDGLYENVGFERYNFRSNIDFDVTDNLKVSLDLAGRLEQRDRPGIGTGTIFSGLVRTPPVAVAFYDNGLPGNYRGGNQIQALRESGYSESTRNIFLGTIKGEYKLPFIKGLTVRGYVSIDRMQEFSKTWTTPYSYYDLQNGEFIERTVGGDPTLSQSFFQGPPPSGSGVPDPTLTMNATFNYENSFDKHEIGALIGVERAQHKSNSFDAFRRGFISGEIDQLFAGDSETSTNNGSAFEAARLGYLGRLNYAFDGRYLFEASFRYDASENFPDDKRWGFFPSFSVGWRISEEAFMPEIEALDELKLRASWGQLGNDRISQFQFLSNYAFSDAYLFGGTNPATVQTLRQGVLANPNVTWETATITNIGLNLGLWGSKLTLEADYFTKTTEDILAFRNLSVPGTFGASLPRENIGEVKNSGFELSAQYRSKFGEIDYWVKGNYTFAQNEVVFIDEPQDVIENLRRTGRPIGAQFGYRALGLFQSQEEIDAHADQGAVAPGDIKYEDINGDDVINGDDRVFLGTTNIPESVYGLSFGLNYKGFDLSVQLQGAGNFNVYLSEEAAWAFFNDGKALELHLDRWTPDNPGATYPRVLTEDSNNRRVSSYWMRDAKYLRVKNVELGYTLPNELISKIGLQSVRTYVSGLNLITFSDLDTFDPEAPSGRGWHYPQQRVFTLGVRVQL